MYSVHATLLLVGLIMLLAGFLGSVGTEGLKNINANVAASFALLFLFTIVVLSFGSYEELRPIFEALTGGVTGEFRVAILSDIADYGSLANVLRQAPVKAAESFFEVVLFALLVELISGLPWSTGKFATDFISRVLTGSVVGLLSLYLLNVVVKQTQLYQWIVMSVGTLITLISVGSIPLSIITAFGKKNLVALGIFGTILAKCSFIRKAFLKSLAFLLGIWILENQFGSLAAAADSISLMIVAFLPVGVMFVGLGMIVKSALFKS